MKKYGENRRDKEDFELSVLCLVLKIMRMPRNFTINGHQKPVSKSLVYDLYGLSDDITVENLLMRWLII